MIRNQVSISLETYTTLLEKENLGEAHSTLVGGGLFYPAEESHRRDVRVLAELRQQGLVDGARISDDFLETLTVMQRAAVEYYTFFAHAGGEQETVRTAAIGRDAVLVVHRNKTIEISPIPVEQLGVRVAAALPETPAAQVHSMSCDNADLEAIIKDKSLPLNNSVRDAKRMKRWLDKDRINVGQLCAGVRDGLGGRKSTKAPMPCWIDTESGRVLLTPTSSGWVNLVGAGLQTISGALQDLEKELRR
ncbi:MAG: ESX secretion-associated protein EspG [Haloechinothrix sp.]